MRECEKTQEEAKRKRRIRKKYEEAKRKDETRWRTRSGRV